MSATYAHGADRSAHELNERIRCLMLRSGGRLTADQRREYEALVAAWATAVRAHPSGVCPPAVR
ncbi:hypothetical protein ACIRF8_18745 [Streptomyces sp. NPDC102406]|uniref:hypothetical protein n=1 Tax=Streptomyces sp. NPDC102406 TaxID=3366171 RepID=UPI00382CC6D5